MYIYNIYATFLQLKFALYILLSIICIYNVTNMQNITQLAFIEKAKRELEKRHKDKHISLARCIKYFFQEELKQEFDLNWHYKVIIKELEELRDWVPKKLIINVPPRTGKTELITKMFPSWLLAQIPTHKFIVSGYSSSLVRNFSSQARDYYTSKTFKVIFPRIKPLKEDQNTKELWETEQGGYYYATGAWGSITWYGADTFIIDDPIKPDESDSDIVREWINNWFSNTVVTRLNNMSKGNIIIIMQRVHSDDLCWHLLEEMKQGTGYEWKLLSFPAIAEEDEEYMIDGEKFFRQEWDILNPRRMPYEALKKIKETMWTTHFSTQYQQNPIAKESQEFHQEWFKEYTERPIGWRVFTAVDPAFSKTHKADESAIITWMFSGECLYIIEYTVWKFDPWELIDHMVNHIMRWSPEKIWIEAYQAQVTINFNLKITLEKLWYYTPIEEIRQKGDKETKIRRLIPLYRQWLIYHPKDNIDKLKKQLLEFPRGRHDDVIDALQMLYDMYTLQPNTPTMFEEPIIKYSPTGQPIY